MTRRCRCHISGSASVWRTGLPARPAWRQSERDHPLRWRHGDDS